MKRLTLKVYVQPGAKKSEIVGMHGDAVKIRINSPPVEGKANEMLVAFLSKVLGVRKSAIQVERGDKSRTKLVAISCNDEVEHTALQHRVSQLLASID